MKQVERNQPHPARAPRLTTQLALFEESKPALRVGGGPPSVQAAYVRAFSEPVLAQLEARLNERPGEWLDCRDFIDIIERNRMRPYGGHALHYLSHLGRAIRKYVYYGAEWPGDPNYQGFNTVYGSNLCGPALERNMRKPHDKR